MSLKLNTQAALPPPPGRYPQMMEFPLEIEIEAAALRPWRL
jgi:hypothetical protein